MHDHSAPLNAIDLLANLIIFLGYMLVPFTVLVRMPLTMFVRVSGVLFFATCGTTHLAMAFNFIDHPLMVLNHVVQAAAVLCFVLSFHRMVSMATARMRQRALEQVVPAPDGDR